MLLPLIVCGAACVAALSGYCFARRQRELGGRTFLIFPLLLALGGIVYCATVDARPGAMFPFAGAAAGLCLIRWGDRDESAAAETTKEP